MLGNLSLLHAARLHQEQLSVLLLEPGNLLSQKFQTLRIGDHSRKIGGVRTCRFGRWLFRMTLPPFLAFHEVDGSIPDDRLQEGDKLGDRAAPKPREAAGVKGGQRFGEDVFGVGCCQPERSERPAADRLERREKGPPSIRISGLTTSDQVEQVRGDRLLPRESSKSETLGGVGAAAPVRGGLSCLPRLSLAAGR